MYCLTLYHHYAMLFSSSPGTDRKIVLNLMVLLLILEKGTRVCVEVCCALTLLRVKFKLDRLNC